MEATPKHHPSSESGAVRLRSWLSILVAGRHDQDHKNQAVVLTVILLGTLVVSCMVALLLAASYLMGNTYVLTRFVTSVCLLIYLGVVALYAYRQNSIQTAALLLITFYLALGGGCVWQWGINNAFGILTLALVIVLAGILLRAQFALVMAGTAWLMLAFIQFGVALGHQPVDGTLTSPSSYGDVLGYGVGFAIIGLVCWLYGHQMERSLQKAERAEIILQAQKANLELIVDKRTAALEQKRLEELEQMYRLTQVGTLSTGLLHELANHLTVLNLDIQHLQQKHNSQALDRIHQTIHYIDGMVDNVRDQLRNDTTTETFDAVDATNQVVQILSHKARESNTELRWKPPRKKNLFVLRGTSVQFKQAITILISNAIEAHENKGIHTVVISLSRTGKVIIIQVSDRGKGISSKHRELLFQPFYTTKKEGIGIGLFIAKQIVKRLGGSIHLDPNPAETTFVIGIPADS